MNNWDFSMEKKNTFVRQKRQTPAFSMYSRKPKKPTLVRSIRKWQKAVTSKSGSTYEYILKVLDDAENKKTVKYCTKYYFCAKFIRHFLVGSKYTFKRSQRNLSKNAVTCCWAYKFGAICDGMCCKEKYQYCLAYDDECECGCDMIPAKARHIKNCYDDCCNIFEYQVSPRGRDFDIIWI